MLYKKQLKRLTKKLIKKQRRRYSIETNEMCPALVKAINKNIKTRFLSGQKLIPYSEWDNSDKSMWRWLANDFFNYAVWVVKRNKYA